MSWLYLFFLLGCGSKKIPDAWRKGIKIQSPKSPLLVISHLEIVHVKEKSKHMSCLWNIKFTEKGGTIFSEMTSAAVGTTLDVFLFEEVISSPEIMEPIMGGQAMIWWPESCAQVHEKYKNIQE